MQWFNIYIPYNQLTTLSLVIISHWAKLSQYCCSIAFHLRPPVYIQVKQAACMGRDVVSILAWNINPTPTPFGSQGPDDIGILILMTNSVSMFPPLVTAAVCSLAQYFSLKGGAVLKQFLEGFSS